MSDLVTNQMLHAELTALRFEFKAEMAALSASVDRRLRAQTWVSTTTLIAGMSLATAVARWA